jgi:hypothetical protein
MEAVPHPTIDFNRIGQLEIQISIGLGDKPSIFLPKPPEEIRCCKIRTDITRKPLPLCRLGLDANPNSQRNGH